MLIDFYKLIIINECAAVIDCSRSYLYVDKSHTRISQDALLNALNITER